MAESENGNGKYRVIGTRPIRHDGVDKVTGRAKYGADYAFPGHAVRQGAAQPLCSRKHQIDQIRQGAQDAGGQGDRHLRGSPEAEDSTQQVGEAAMNPRYLSMNILAHDKALYDGHAIAAVAATSPHIAEEALRHIEVEYEVLPPVMTVDDAMKKNAGILCRSYATRKRATIRPTSPATCSSSAAMSRLVSRPPILWWSASSTPRWSTRDTSSRITRSGSTIPMVTGRSTARPRAPSTCARCARRC